MSLSAERLRVEAPNERTEARLSHHSSYSPARVASEKARLGCTVSVCLPARECAATIGEIVAALAGLRRTGAIDEVVVVDAGSADGSAAIARQAGARVLQEAELMPAFGPVLGKGDAMWRALSALSGDVVCFLDADTERFGSHFATGLLGALLCEPGVSFAKAFYRRPLVHGELSLPDGGGRVNHLLARPALELIYPQLAGVRQPLAGEVAARRALLEELPFATGYGVEVAMLIDVWRRVGMDAIAQVDLDEHRNRNQPLPALSAMALTVLATVITRAQREGRLGGMGGRDPASQRSPANGFAAGDAAAGKLADAPGDGEGPEDGGAGQPWRAPLERPPLRSVPAAQRA